MNNIPVANPLRWIDLSEINFSFDGNFAINQLHDYQTPECYFQPWAHTDVLKQQIQFDSVPTDVQFRDCSTDMVVATAAWAPVDTLVTGFTFTVYELQFSFSLLPPGRYYATFEFTDEDDQVHPLRSEPFHVKVKHENTLLIKYKHSENDYDIVFDTGIEFQFRVESAIKNLNPKNNRSVYNDQQVNSTQLSATPYRVFKFFIGYKYGVPEWVMDKINWIQSCDQVKYNEVFYQVIDQAEYEIEINDSNSFMGGSIDVQPVNNKFNKYKTEAPVDGGDNTFIPMQKVTPFYNVADNFYVAGKFKKFTVLEKICVEKRSAADITLKLGVTPGGKEIGEFVIGEIELAEYEIVNEDTDPAFVDTIEKMFTGTKTLYLSGLDVPGTDCDIFLVYKQLDEPPIDLGAGSGSAPPPIGRGAKVRYEEIQPGDLDLDFEISTGIGRANTPWAGWVIAGTNGTADEGGRTVRGYDPNVPKYSEIGSTGGADQIVLTEAQLPHVELFGYGVGGIDNNQWGGGLGYNRNTPKDKPITSFGGGQAISIDPKYIVALWVVKIV